MIKASDFQRSVDVRDANRRKQTGDHSDECFLCGRGLTDRAVRNGWWIHLTTGGLLVEQTYNGEDSQGRFPVGSECAKFLPKSAKFKI